MEIVDELRQYYGIIPGGKSGGFRVRLSTWGEQKENKRHVADRDMLSLVVDVTFVDDGPFAGPVAEALIVDWLHDMSTLWGPDTVHHRATGFDSVASIRAWAEIIMAANDYVKVEEWSPSTRPT